MEINGSVLDGRNSQPLREASTISRVLLSTPQTHSTPFVILPHTKQMHVSLKNHTIYVKVIVSLFGMP